MRRRILAVIGALLVVTAASAETEQFAEGQLLVTFDNSGASVASGSVRAPYRARKRYEIAVSTRRAADAVAREYALEEVEHWPIRSLGLYCFVYRIPAGVSRDDMIDRLNRDERVESAQPLQEFETGARGSDSYNDPYVHLQRGFELLQVSSAHRHASGAGIQVAIVDSGVDATHEDLDGQLRDVRVLTSRSHTPDQLHGTAVASIIAANANNALGIVGVAPDAVVNVYVACWASAGAAGATCDSFTLAKAFDTVLMDAPDVLNVSLRGPHDPLLARLLQKLGDHGVVIVAAGGAEGEPPFPASLPGVVGVFQAEEPPSPVDRLRIYAPGEQIMVAVPGDRYEFRSGSSLSAAHVTGAIALLLSRHPELTPADVRRVLAASQKTMATGTTTIDTCRMMALADSTVVCRDAVARQTSESQLHAK